MQGNFPLQTGIRSQYLPLHSVGAELSSAWAAHPGAYNNEAPSLDTNSCMTERRPIAFFHCTIVFERNLTRLTFKSFTSPTRILATRQPSASVIARSHPSGKWMSLWSMLRIRWSVQQTSFIPSVISLSAALRTPSRFFDA